MDSKLYVAQTDLKVELLRSPVDASGRSFDLAQGTVVEAVGKQGDAHVMKLLSRLWDMPSYFFVKELEPDVFKPLTP